MTLTLFDYIFYPLLAFFVGMLFVGLDWLHSQYIKKREGYIDYDFDEDLES